MIDTISKGARHSYLCQFFSYRYTRVYLWTARILVCGRNFWVVLVPL